MIFLNKNTTNQIVLTLTESSRLNSPNYLFIFQNEFDLTQTDIPFTTPDKSGYTDRYNLFEIKEAVTGSTSGGNNVPLSFVAGQYKYKVYESTGTTLSISATTGRILEYGRMVVAGEENTTITTGRTSSIYL